jgi:hypothetical protein
MAHCEGLACAQARKLVLRKSTRAWVIILSCNAQCGLKHDSICMRLQQRLWAHHSDAHQAVRRPPVHHDCVTNECADPLNHPLCIDAATSKPFEGTPSVFRGNPNCAGVVSNPCLQIGGPVCACSGGSNSGGFIKLDEAGSVCVPLQVDWCICFHIGCGVQ